jgi:imidazolonepropionase-like amidohydrolase
MPTGQPDLDTGEWAGFLGSPQLPRGAFDGPLGARRAVRLMVRSGADVIKVAATGSATQPETADLQQVADDELTEIVAEAGRAGRHVMVHAHGARVAEVAARAGARSIEHGARLDQDAVSVLAEHGTWLVPTLLPSQTVEEDEPAWRAELRETAAQAFRWAVAAGVPIAMGTDCPMVPHERRLEELEHMHRLGMTTAQVWRAATFDAARLLDRHDLGLIEPGRRADIVAVRGDLADLTGLADRIAWVLKDGLPVPTDP